MQRVNLGLITNEAVTLPDPTLRLRNVTGPYLTQPTDSKCGVFLGTQTSSNNWGNVLTFINLPIQPLTFNEQSYTQTVT